MPGTSLHTAVTIADVARAAGVSRATVSRVMNAKASVDPALAERVRAEADRLGYTPSSLARSLSLGRTQTVALLVPDLANPMFARILRGMNTAATQAGYHVLVADSAEDPSREAALALEARRRCDGLVLCSPRMPAEDLAGVLRTSRPIAVINRHPLGSLASVPAIGVDYEAGIAGLIDHLRELGHHHLVYVAGPTDSVSNEQRRAGLAEARGKWGIRIDEVVGGSTIAAGAGAARAAFATGATAVLAFNDLVALGLLQVAHQEGLAVPAELSVAGFDDIDFAQFSTPALTTMVVPQEELGERAWQLILVQLEAIQGKAGSRSAQAREATGEDAAGGGNETAAMPGRAAEIITPQLVVRSSTGPARA